MNKKKKLFFIFLFLVLLSSCGLYQEKSGEREMLGKWQITGVVSEEMGLEDWDQNWEKNLGTIIINPDYIYFEDSSGQSDLVDYQIAYLYQTDRISLVSDGLNGGNAGFESYLEFVGHDWKRVRMYNLIGHGIDVEDEKEGIAQDKIPDFTANLVLYLKKLDSKESADNLISQEMIDKSTYNPDTVLLGDDFREYVLDIGQRLKN